MDSEANGTSAEREQPLLSDALRAQRSVSGGRVLGSPNAMPVGKSVVHRPDTYSHFAATGMRGVE